MLHQEINSYKSGQNDIRYYHAAQFPEPHIHRSAELMFVEKGSVSLYVNGNIVCVRAGSCALILPAQVHGFTCGEDARFWVQVFSADCAPGFFGMLGAREPQTPVFMPSGAAADFYRDTCLMLPDIGTRTGRFSLEAALTLPPLKLRAALYAVLSDFLDSAVLVRRDNTHAQLYGRVMEYIIENCTEDLTLASTAAHFGYEPHYFSRCLSRTSPASFRMLVNRCRVDRAKELLEDRRSSITEIALACGFGCMRTFNRVFQTLEGMTPREFRETFAK